MLSLVLASLTGVFKRWSNRVWTSPGTQTVTEQTHSRIEGRSLSLQGLVGNSWSAHSPLLELQSTQMVATTWPMESRSSLDVRCRVVSLEVAQLDMGVSIGARELSDRMHLFWIMQGVYSAQDSRRHQSQDTPHLAGQGQLNNYQTPSTFPCPRRRRQMQRSSAYANPFREPLPKNQIPSPDLPIPVHLVYRPMAVCLCHAAVGEAVL